MLYSLESIFRKYSGLALSMSHASDGLNIACPADRIPVCYCDPWEMHFSTSVVCINSL